MLTQAAAAACNQAFFSLASPALPPLLAQEKARCTSAPGTAVWVVLCTRRRRCEVGAVGGWERHGENDCDLPRRQRPHAQVGSAVRSPARLGGASELGWQLTRFGCLFCCRVRQSLNAQAGSSGKWKVLPEQMEFRVAVQAADVVVVLLTPAWSASASAREDLSATQGLRLAAYETGAAKPWQQASPVVILIGFEGVDWSDDSVAQLFNANPSVKHNGASLLLGDVRGSLFLLWRLVDQI